ncbi:MULTISPECIES: LysR family transcriptional regulator [unclassified Acidovorax]|uniref:LysR family transcriptional regulator n=1 Tax=unclassified Acidovorax TaxID=2684926 RepID=UPI00288326A1|nr:MULTISPECIES: LysR family transcriptional regulator [unclassified Acidovorax]
MRLDLADLRLFLSVVDAGSITQGAVQANLALASASERLRHIEADAGVPLLQRRPRGVVATEAGEALAHHARLIVRQQALLRGELRDFAAGARGTLHLYANTAALTEFLPRQLGAWLAERPGLQVDLKERTSADIVRLIGAGLAQAGIVSDAVDAPGLQLQPVARDRLVLIAPLAHPIAQAGLSVRFVDVLGEAFVGLSAGHALQDHIDEHARAAGAVLATRIRMNTFDGQCDMVSHGVGVAIVPQSTARRLRRGRHYRAVPLLDGWAQRRLCLCYSDWPSLPPALQSLLRHLGATVTPA